MMDPSNLAKLVPGFEFLQDLVRGAGDCDGDAVGYGGGGLGLAGCEGFECGVRPGLAGDVEEGAALLATFQGGFGAAAEGGG